MYINYNPNPYGSRTGDCVIRSVAKATGQDWGKAYIDLCLEGLLIGDLPSSNAVWGSYLAKRGYEKNVVPVKVGGTTIKEFLSDHNHGTYVMCTGTHAVCAIDGNHYDSWDSSDEVVLYYFVKKE